MKRKHLCECKCFIWKALYSNFQVQHRRGWNRKLWLRWLSLPISSQDRYTETWQEQQNANQLLLSKAQHTSFHETSQSKSDEYIFGTLFVVCSSLKVLLTLKLLLLKTTHMCHLKQKVLRRRKQNRGLITVNLFNQRDTSDASMTFPIRCEFNTQHMCFQAH